jgi:hypothetical protein
MEPANAMQLEEARVVAKIHGFGRDIRPGFTVDPQLVAKKNPLCLFVPGTARRKWRYGFSLEDVWDGMKMGCVLFEGSHITALSCNDIVKVAARLRDTTTPNKAFDKNVYITGYAPKIERQLMLVWDEFFAKLLEEQEQLLKLAKEEFGARRKKKSPLQIRHPQHPHHQCYIPKKVGVSGR